MRFHLKKNNFTTKIKLCTTGEFISNDISFEKKNNFTTKIKLYTTGEFISNDISFDKKIKKQFHYKNEALHNW